MTEQKRKPYVLSNDDADYEAIKRAIDETLEEALDPDAWATRKMFEKIKGNNTFDKDAGFDVEAWDKHDVWIPTGTKLK